MNCNPLFVVSDIKYLSLAALAGASVLLGAAAEGKEAKDNAAQAVELLCPEVKAKKGAKKQAPLRNMLSKIAKGGDINAADKSGQTALIHAARQGERYVVCWLVAKGADVTLKDKKGKKAYDYAQSSALRRLLLTCEREKEPLTLKQKKEIDLGADAQPEKLREQFLSEGWDMPKCEALIKAKVDLAPGTDPKVKPLMVNGKMRAETLAYLVRHGLDVNAHARGANGQLICSEKMSPEVCTMLAVCGLQVDPEKDDPTALFWLALRSNDVEGVKRVAAKHPDLVNSATEKGSPLANAATVKMVQALIEAGADPKKQGSHTVLDDAIVNGAPGEVLQELAKAGAKVTPEADKAPFQYAMDRATYTPDMTGLILVAPEHELIRNGTYLRWALRERRADAIKMLLEKRIAMDENSSSLKGYNALEGAIDEIPLGMFSDGTEDRRLDYTDRYTQVPKIVQQLLKSGYKPREATWYKLFFGVPIVAEYTLPAVHEAYAETLRLLISSGNAIPPDSLARVNERRNMSPTEYSKIVTMLLKAGVDPKVICNERPSATPLFSAGASADAAKQLIAAGVDLNAKNREGEIALHRVQTAAVAEMLIQKGVDVNTLSTSDITDKWNEGGVPAICKVLSDSKLVKIEVLPVVKALVDAGAKAHGSNNKGEWDAFCHMPMELSDEDFTKLAELLKKAGGNPNYAWESDNTTERILKIGADVNAKNTRGRTPLMLRPDDTRQLLNAGADPNAQDEDGATSLYHARRDAEVVALLLQHKADPNIKNNKGQTQLEAIMAENTPREYYAKIKNQVVELIKSHTETGK